MAGNACADGVPPSGLAQIKAVAAGMDSAAHARDTDAFMAGFRHGPDLVCAINGKVIRGRDALRAQQLQWWRNGNSDVICAKRGKPECMELAPGVVAASLRLSSKRTLPNGKIGTGDFVATDIWKHPPQGWRTIYGHESWTRPPG